ncbi:type IV secretion system protein, partial [Acinetobacter baumannii]|nr:type IV secretion system protein [Acinetobacter baumannii]
NLGSILPMYFFCALALIAMIALALFMMLTYLEFYISASLSIVSVPFSAWKMTKFIPEGMVGHLVSATFKLLLVSMMVATCATG